jgi:hypothetical protein
MEVKTQNQTSHNSWYKERGHSRYRAALLLTNG